MTESEPNLLPPGWEVVASGPTTVIPYDQCTENVGDCGRCYLRAGHSGAHVHLTIHHYGLSPEAMNAQDTDDVPQDSYPPDMMDEDLMIVAGQGQLWAFRVGEMRKIIAGELLPVDVHPVGRVHLPVSANSTTGDT